MIQKNTKLICIKEYTEVAYKYKYTIGKPYFAEIKGKLKDEVNIADDNGNELKFFTWSFFNDAYVSEYFRISIKENRKEKIEKLNSL